MRKRRLPVAGLVLGLGIGGFIDGIVLHMLLEWHHMLSSWHPPTEPDHVRTNMIGDGMFHLLCLALVLAGVYLLQAAAREETVGPRELTGWMIAGWGVFNLVEGVVDHLVLGVHHVRETGNELAWDLGFLVFGALLVAGGTALARASQAAADRVAR